MKARRHWLLWLGCYVALALPSAHAQDSPPANVNPTTELAISLLNSYGLPADSLPQLSLALRVGDDAALDEVLSAYELSSAQANALISGLNALLDSGGLDAPSLADYAAYQFFTMLAALGVDASQYAPFFRAVDDPDAFADLLAQLGLSPEESAFFADNQRQLVGLGLDEAALDNYLSELILLGILSDLGVAPADLPAMLSAYNADEQTFAVLLESAGISIDDFIGAYDSAYFDVYFGYGFSPDDLIDFSDAIFVELVADARQDPLQLRALLINYGYSEAEIAEFAAAQAEGALGDLLARYGFDAQDPAFDTPPSAPSP